MKKLRDVLEQKNKEYHSHFVTNIVKVTPILEKCTPTEYTFHGLKHSIKIEYYLDHLISDIQKDKLEPEEIFVLLNGAYYHDIGMSRYEEVQDIFTDENGIKKTFKSLESKRAEHNLISKKMIYDNKNNKFDNNLISLPDNDASFAKSIADICYGHRDYITQENKRIKTLEEIDLSEDYCDVTIHTRYLAALLRLADELDITNQRAPSDVLFHLKTFIPPESVTEWLNHNLFGKVEIDASLFKITLSPHKNNIHQRDKEVGDKTKIRNLLFSKIKKINNELDIIQEALETENTESDYKLGYEKVNIKFVDNIVTREDKTNYDRSVKKAFIDEESGGLTTEQNQIPYTTTESKKTKTIDYKRLFLKEIEILKDKKKLISVGSFRLPSNHFSKFYINTNIVVSDNKILDLLTSSLKCDLAEISYDYIFGIDKTGIIIGSNLSIKTNHNFTYAMFSKNGNHSIEFENNVSEKIKNKKLVIITDVIASGTTLDETIKKCKTDYQSEIVAVCCMFSVNESKIDKLKKEHKFELIILSNEFSYDTYSSEDIKENSKLKQEFELLRKT